MTTQTKRPKRETKPATATAPEPSIGGYFPAEVTAPPKQNPRPMPEWLRETPFIPHPWKLIIESGGDKEWLEEIDLSLEEYIALKQHLGRLRGYPVTELTEEQHQIVLGGGQGHRPFSKDSSATTEPPK